MLLNNESKVDNFAKKENLRREILHNENGAIDLASIMVGIIVIGMVGSVVAATVFAVIPWSQDSAAKQQLSNLVAAEGAYVGLKADSGNIEFGHAADLARKTTSNPQGKGLFDAAAAGVAIAINGDGIGSRYGGVIESKSGKFFYLTSGDTKPKQVMAHAGEDPNNRNHMLHAAHEIVEDFTDEDLTYHWTDWTGAQPLAYELDHM